MEFIALFLTILFWTFLFITLVGIARPWWVLWFLDMSNRLAVLKYYGVITLLLGVAVVIMKIV